VFGVEELPRGNIVARWRFRHWCSGSRCNNLGCMYSVGFMTQALEIVV
jgi:hypothetical protein